MKMGLGGALLLASTLGLSLLTGPASAMPTQADDAAAALATAAEPRKRDFLPACETAASMNCVESIEYMVDGEWKFATGPTNIRTIESDDGNGNIVYGDTIAVFGTSDLVHSGGRSQVVTHLVERDDINGPPYAAYQVTIQPYPHSDSVRLADSNYRYTFRTSTLIPVFAQSTMLDTQTSVTQVPGGLRVSISGMPGPSQFAGDDAERTDTFEAVTYEWNAFFSDARARGGELQACQGLGIATAYSNGYGGQMPEWDARTGSISFGVSGFHFAPDGSVYKGEAEIFVPGPLARCMWKVDPRQTARMEIEVFSENGEEVAGTKAISYDAESDLVKLIATNFTYSEKQIVARPTPLAAKPGKAVCTSSTSACVTVDRSRKSARVSVSKLLGASQVIAVAMRGNREDSSTQVIGRVNKGKASLSLKLSGAKAKEQVWVVRTPSTFIASFQVA